MNTPNRARKHVTRRTHSAAFKRKLLQLSQQPGASVAAIALEHGINANLLFKWRRQDATRHAKAVADVPILLPVILDTAALPASGTPMPRASTSGTIEVEFGGTRLRLRGVIDEVSLRSVLRALREAA